MKLHKLNTRYLICFLFILSILILAARVIYMLSTGQVSDHEEPMSPVMSKTFIALIILPVSSYFYSFIIMLRQYIKHKGTAYTLTENGIENTLTSVILLSFIFVVPVNSIQWESIKNVDISDGFIIIRMSIKKVNASFLAKCILFIRGYSFCYKFSSPYITEEEIGINYPLIIE